MTFKIITRVQYVNGDSSSFQSAGQFLGMQNVGKFRLAVCFECVIVLLPVQVLPVHAGTLVSHAGDNHNSGISLKRLSVNNKSRPTFSQKCQNLAPKLFAALTIFIWESADIYGQSFIF